MNCYCDTPTSCNKNSDSEQHANHQCVAASTYTNCFCKSIQRSDIYKRYSSHDTRLFVFSDIIHFISNISDNRTSHKRVNYRHVITLVMIIFLSTLALPVNCMINFKPRFTERTRIIKIQENSLPGTMIDDISRYVQDDEGDSILYSIDPIGAQLCHISRATGQLRLSVSPDREVQSMYKFSVFASDDFEGGVNRKVKMDVYLYLIDVNDNNPQFQNTPYHTKVDEDIAVGSLIMTVVALDKDTGVNAEVTYSFTGMTSDDKFRIGARSGNVYVKEKLDYEKKQSYTIFIRAQDNGSPTRYEMTTLVVELNDINDTPPYFEFPGLPRYLDENLPIGTSVAQVRAKDGDASIQTPIRYEIVSGDEYGMFKIDPIHGNITVRGILDREYYAEFDLKIKAYEYGFPDSFAVMSLKVFLRDKNDNKPKFVGDPYTIWIRDDTDGGTVISTDIHAVDLDTKYENNRIVYSNGYTHDIFRIERDSGELVLLVSPLNLVDGPKDKYKFKVYAEEVSTRERYKTSANVTVLIERTVPNEPETAGITGHAHIGTQTHVKLIALCVCFATALVTWDILLPNR